MENNKKRKSLQLLKNLVDTKSYVRKSENEIKLANYIIKYLSDADNTLIIKKQYLQGKTGRFNVFVSRTNNPKLVFSGHLDTVIESDLQKYNLDSILTSDKLFGVGIADMKSAIAVMIIAFIESKADIGLILTCDEEYEFEGIKQVIKDFCWKPALCLLGEPTNFTVENASKGCIEVEIITKGFSAHASTPSLGINAIEQTICAVNFLKTKFGVDSTVNLANIFGGKINNNVVEIQPNCVPDYCKVILDIRNSKKISKNGFKKLVKEALEKYKISLVELKFDIFLPPLEVKTAKLKKLMELLRKMDKNTKFREINETQGISEAVFYQNALKIPAVCYGINDFNSSHTQEEFIRKADFFKLIEVYTYIAKNY